MSCHPLSLYPSVSQAWVFGCCTWSVRFFYVCSAFIRSVRSVRFVCSICSVRSICFIHFVRFIFSVYSVYFVCSVYSVCFVCSICSVYSICFICSICSICYVYFLCICFALVVLTFKNSKTIQINQVEPKTEENIFIRKDGSSPFAPVYRTRVSRPLPF